MFPRTSGRPGRQRLRLPSTRKCCAAQPAVPFHPFLLPSSQHGRNNQHSVQKKEPAWAPEPAAERPFSVVHCTRARQEVVAQQDYSGPAGLGSDRDLAAVFTSAASSSEAELRGSDGRAARVGRDSRPMRGMFCHVPQRDPELAPLSRF